MAEETHHAKVEVYEYTDPRTGKVKKGYRVQYVRSEATQVQAERDRLGVLADAPVTHSDRVLTRLKDPHLLWVCSEPDAKTVIRTRLEGDRRSHRVLNGADLLRYYLEGKEGAFFADLLGGFPNVPQLYLMAGYIEARNKYMGDLMVQIAGQRFQAKRDLWIFMPQELPTMVSKWGPSIVDLGYYPTAGLSGLSEVAGMPAPEITQTRLDPVRDPHYDRRNGASKEVPNSRLGGGGGGGGAMLPSLGEGTDAKFAKKKRKDDRKRS